MLKDGTIINDRYEVIGKIGAGGMSDVYKAKDHTLGRNVAIKVLKPEFSEDSIFVGKFRAEAQAAAGLEHPNIVNVYDVGCQDGDYYIVMECVEGITLKTYIEKKGQLTFKEALSIAIQVGRGIQAAHAKNIIHRDIKPQNIIISTEGKVKVTDFGIARAATNNTISSDVMGSVHYASPEQARNGYVSNKSDIYSLGIVMYEMVTGRVPFDGDNTVAVAIQHLQDEMISPSAYAKDLPISLEKIILKCTQKSPDRRYDSIDDLLIDLRKSLLTPYEDFVDIAPLVQDKTRVISRDEVEQIQKETGKMAPDDDDDEDGEYEYDSDDDDDEDGEYEYDSDDDDDDDGRKGGFLNKKMEKAVTIMGIVAAIVIVIIVIYIVGSFMGVFHFGSKKKPDTTPISVSQEAAETVKVPKLVGKTFEEAEEELKEMGLKLQQSGTEVDEDAEPGEILSQDIEEGEEVEVGSVIKVVVCAESEEADVPNVVGDSLSTAESKLTAAGFKVERSYETDDSVEEGTVLSQSPSAGRSLKKGETVTITISQESGYVTVPNLLDKTESEAKQALKDAGLEVGTVTQEYSDTVDAGKVISQSTSSGKYLPKGDTVSIVVSKGAEEKETLYKFGANVKAPSGYEVTGADIELIGAESDEVIQSWHATSFPYEINVSNIKDYSSGTLVIIWYYTGEDGSQRQSEPQEKSVNFNKM